VSIIAGPTTSPEISADRMSLVDVVKGLGEYLTADEEDLRRKGSCRQIILLSFM